MQTLEQTITNRLELKVDFTGEELLGYLIAILSYTDYSFQQEDTVLPTFNFVHWTLFLSRENIPEHHQVISKLGLKILVKLRELDCQGPFVHHRVLDHAIGVQCDSECPLRNNEILDQLSLKHTPRKLLTHDKSSSNGNGQAHSELL